MSAGNIIKHWSYDLCMSVPEIAKEAGVSAPTLYKYIDGSRTPLLSMVRKLRNFAKDKGLNVPPIEDFYEDD